MGRREEFCKRRAEREKVQEPSSIQYNSPTKPDAERDKTHSLQIGRSRDR